MHRSQRDSVGALLSFPGAWAPAPGHSSVPQPRVRQDDALAQAEYAAELRAQMAAAEARKRSERAASLRESAALLQLRTGAASGVLPSGLAARQQAHTSSVGGGGGSSQRQLFGLGPGHDPFSAQRQQQPAGPAAWPAQRAASADPWQALAPAQQPSRAPHAAALPPSAARAHQEQPWRGPPEQELGGWLDARQAPMPRHDAPPPGYPPQPAPYPAGHGGLQRMPSMAPQPPYGTEQQLGPGPAPLPPAQWRAAGAAAPYGTDLLPPPAPLARTRSLRPAAGDALPPWAAPPSPAGQQQRSPPAAAGPTWGGGRLAEIGGGQVEGCAARAAQERRQAEYRAELEGQLALKEERRRQEKERDRAEEAGQARQAQALVAKAAAGSYGGGSGPLRDASGRPVTDLNQARRGAASRSGRHVRRYQEGRSQPGSPSANTDAGIPAHWSAGAADGSKAWQSGLQRGSSGVPPAAHGQHQDQAADRGWPGQGALPHVGWEEAPGMPPVSMPAGYPPPTSLQAAPASPSKPPGSWASGWASNAPSAPGASAAAEPVSLRLRSDRPYQTASEAERRAAQQAEFKEALRQQVEDKARLKAEEQRRRRAEEAEEEARLAREQERLRQQYAADQSRQRAKRSEKEAGGAETLESGGVTIKFKPPPAGAAAAGQRASARRQQAQAVEPDDAVPGVEIWVGRRPPPPPPVADEPDPARLPEPAGGTAAAAAAEGQPELSRHQGMSADPPGPGPTPPQQAAAVPPLPVGQAVAGPPYHMQPPWVMAPPMQSQPYSAGPPAWGMPLQQQQQAFLPAASPLQAPPGFAAPGQPYPPWAQPPPTAFVAQMPPWAQPPPPQPPAFSAPLPPWAQAPGPPMPGGPPPWLQPPPTQQQAQPGTFGQPFAPPGPPLGFGAPAITVQPGPPNRHFAGPVIHTSSELSLRDSSSRPPTARDVGLPPLAPPSGAARLPGATLGTRSASFLPDREEAPPAGPAIVRRRSTLVFPPQPAPAATQQAAQGEARRSSGAGGAGRRSSIAAALPALAPAPKPPPSRGLQQWDSLNQRSVPFSRASSPTPPISEHEEGPSAPPAARRGSWAGLDGRPGWPA